MTSAKGDALKAIRGETAVVTVGGREADVVVREREREGRTRPQDETSVSIVGPDWEVATELSLFDRHQATNAGVAATLTGLGRRSFGD